MRVGYKTDRLYLLFRIRKRYYGNQRIKGGSRMSR